MCRLLRNPSTGLEVSQIAYYRSVPAERSGLESSRLTKRIHSFTRLSCLPLLSILRHGGLFFVAPKMRRHRKKEGRHSERREKSLPGDQKTTYRVLDVTV
jgi:hypothetical protein